MRNLLLMLCLGWALAPARAQEVFEGEIRFKIKMESADIPPGYESMMPTQMVYKFRDGHARMTSDAAMMNDMLIRQDDSAMYLLVPQQKSALRVISNESDAEAPEYSVTTTNETAEIAGYRCQKYTVDLRDGDQTIRQYIWATEALPAPSPIDASNPFMQQSNMFSDQIKGFPLKMTMRTPEMSMEMTATNVSRTPPPASDFVVPESYRIQDLDPMQMLRSLGN